MKASVAGALLLLLVGVNSAAQDKGVVEGEVVNSVTGAPVPRARVALQRFVNGESRGYNTQTAADGKFSVSGIESGSYAVVVTRNGYVASHNPQMTELSGNMANTAMKIKLVPTAAISGRVIDSAGEPVDGGEVVAYCTSGQQNALADERGQFRIGGLSPGRCRLVANTAHALPIPPEIRTDGTSELLHARTWYPNSLERQSAGWIRVGPGAELSDIEIRLVRVPIICVSGTVAGIPADAKNVLVQFSNRREGAYGSMARVKADGTFRIWRLSPGKYIVSASWFGAGGGGAGNQSRTTAVEVEIGQSDVEGVELRYMPPSEIAGQVEYEGDQQGKRKPGVIRFDTTNDFGMQQTANIAGDGSFHLDKLPAGSYEMVAWASQDYYVKSMRLGETEIDGSRLDFPGGGGQTKLTVVLSSAMGQLSGAVTGDDPATCSVLHLVRPDSISAASRRTSAIQNGKYEFTGVPPGEYRLLLSGRSWVISNDSPFTDGADSVEIRANEKTTKDVSCPAAEGN